MPYTEHTYGERWNTDVWDEITRRAAQHHCTLEATTKQGLFLMQCITDSQGRMWLEMGEQYTQINFCPQCGLPATNPKEESLAR